MFEKYLSPDGLDAGLLAASHRVKYSEITSYGCVRS